MKICNRIVESTPCENLWVTYKGEIVARLSSYWTENRGLYGYQIAYTITLCNGNGRFLLVGPDQYSEHVTSGCGHSKTSAAFEHFLNVLFPNNVHHSLGHDVTSLLHSSQIKISRQSLRRAIIAADNRRNRINGVTSA